MHGWLLNGCGTRFDNDGVMFDSPACPTARLETPRDDEDAERDREPDDTPETPLDEPPPPHVDDPPTQPDQKGPYVVSAW